MSYRPQRTFNGTQGNPSTDTMGPEQLSHDIDELCKMFNPTSIHSDGSAGGVTADNLNFTGLDINEIGGVASGDIKAIRVKMNGDIEYTTDGETYHPAFAREANYLPLAGGTMSGTLNMNNNKITNLATPEAGSDPATKNYTDAIRTALEVAIALKAPIESPTFTGTPTAPTPSTADSSTQIATTAFTQAVAAGVAGNTYSKADADAKFETIANANKLVKDVSYNSETGTFTIVTQDGTTTTIDTNIEKIPVSVSIIQSGSTYKLRITNEDGSYSECDVSAMFNAITFVDSTEIAFTETTNQDGSKNVTASIKPGSIVGSKLDPDYKDILDALVDRAETAETNAQNSADNAADSATAAAGSASAASGSASAAANSVTSASQYASAAEGFKNQASNSATAAASSATEAATSASNASTSETNAAASASSAATSASNAATSASDAASDAQRTQELTNEAMEYATDAAGSQIDAETAARNAAASATTATTKASEAATSASNASTSETNAANSATAAAASAASVGTQASDAEAAARGTRNGVPVGPDDEFYHDNAEYYKDQAASIVGPQQPKITVTGILKGEGDGVVTSAVAGTDYQAPLPSQSGQSGKFLTTDGSALSWGSALDNAYFGHLDTNANILYLPKNWTYYTGGSDYSYWFPFIAKHNYDNNIKSGLKLREFGSSSNLFTIEGLYYEGERKTLPFSLPRGIYLADFDDGFLEVYRVTTKSDLSTYAPLASPAFTGTPTAPTPTSSSDATQIATKGYVDNHTPDLSGYMQKGVDYVTAGQKSGTTLGTKATAEGNDTTSSGTTSHAEGTDTVASGDYSHAEGFVGFALGQSSHIEGQGTASKNIFITKTITGAANTKVYSVSEANDFSILGIIKNDDENKCAYITDIDYQNDQITLSAAISTVAFTNKEVSYLSSTATQYDGPIYSRTTGPKVAMGAVSHAEGLTTMALGLASHAEGRITTSIGNGAHSEGLWTTAVGITSHAEGYLTTANGDSSHAEGIGTIANGDYQHTFGEYNIFDDVKYSRYGIPKGRMRGDINGDGVIDETDVDIITKHLTNIEIITDAVALWCADANANNEVKTNDKSIITKYINKISTVLTSTPTFADYYNNWTYVKVDDLTGYWTYNITLSSGDATNLVNVYAANLVSYSLSGTTLTVNVSRPPITASSILIDVGSGNGSYSEHIEIVGGGKTSAYLSNARTLDWLGNETLAGKLTVGEGPTDDMDVATKQYVDSKEAPPEVFLVTATTSNGTITADKTFAEILAAYNAGKICVVNFDNSHICPLMYISNTGASFCKTATTSDGAYQRDVSVTNANVWNTTIVPLQTRTTASGILKGDGAGGVTAAVAGTDYVARPEVFIAIYGTTTSTEIYNAYTAGKLVIVSGLIPPYNFKASGFLLDATSSFARFMVPYLFTTTEIPIMAICCVNNDTWRTDSYQLSKTDHSHDASDITSGTLGVARGGTGAASFTANSVVMSGSSTTAALTTRAVTNNTAASTALTASTNIPTVNTLVYGLNRYLNRSTLVNAADTGYTTYMARGEALNSADTNPSVNGAISWTYA